MMKLLVPYDGSPTSAVALEKACTLAREQRAFLLLQHVVTQDSLSHSLLMARLLRAPQLSPDERVEQIQMEIQAWGLQVLAPAIARCKASGVEFLWRIDTGTPDVQICQVAVSQAIDLIVMGSEGFGSRSALGLGQTTLEVLKGAPCSVLIAKAEAQVHGLDAEPDDEERGVREALVL